MSVFSGIGGFELGLHRAGHETKSFCEADPAARAVLNARFPGVPISNDVRGVRRIPKGIDMITAGFPCQNLSQAGDTRGIFGVRSGLVKELFRLLETNQPRFVLIENVPFMLRLKRGRAIQVIVEKLESLGYGWAYRTIDAQSFGLPHRRPRVFLLASRSEDVRAILLGCDAGKLPRQKTVRSFGFYWTEGTRGIGWATNSLPVLKAGSAIGVPSPPAMILPDGRVATPHICDAERLQGFPAHWTSPASRVTARRHRWRLVGNAVNVRVSRWIGSRLNVSSDSGPSKVHRLSGPPWPKAAFSSKGGRWAADCSEFPVNRRFAPLHEFLRFQPAPLSVKATAGVFGRLQSSNLNLNPILLERLEAHLESFTTVAG
jgi:DNA (cytosine-5)-methyltransferase 1